MTSYRGYDIYEIDRGNFEIRQGGYVVTRCGSAWSCIAYIDERLSP